MQTLLLATTSGVMRIAGAAVEREEGPPSAAYLARGENETYALTSGGALWARAGTAWRLINQRTVPDEPWSFAADPRLPGRLYIGVSPALLYRSDDGGLTWTACDSLRRVPGYDTWTFPPPPHIPHVRSIATDPGAPGALYIGVEEGGVFRSPDGGETWQSLNDGLYWDVHTVSSSPTRRDLFATTGAGFHKSEDGGGHWRHVTNGITNRYTVPLLVSRARPGSVFTAAAAGPPPTWSQGVRGALFASEDAGENWRRLDSGLPQSFDVMVSALVEDEAGSLFAAAGDKLYASQDGGDNWNTLATGLPAVRAACSVP